MNVPCHPLMLAKWSEAHEEDRQHHGTTYLCAMHQAIASYKRDRDDGPPEFYAANIIIE